MFAFAFTYCFSLAEVSHLEVRGNEIQASEKKKTQSETETQTGLWEFGDFDWVCPHSTTHSEKCNHRPVNQTLLSD